MMEVIQFLNLNVEIIRKPGRRRLTLYMHPDKILSVKTNRRTSQSQIFDFLTLKQKWIEKNITKFAAIAVQFKTPTFSEGSLYPFLGEQKYLQFSVTPARSVFFIVEHGFLVCYLPDNIRPAELNPVEMNRALRKYYRSEAESYLKERLLFWADVTSLKPLNVSFRSNKTRWGSCSSGRSISLNWKLICQSTSLIDYVIVHELCHLKHLNHSKDFWNLVESFLPDHKTIKTILNQQQHISHFLG